MADLKGLPKPRRDLVPGTQCKGYLPIPIGVETSILTKKYRFLELFIPGIIAMAVMTAWSEEAT
jgi:hypothetical protein